MCSLFSVLAVIVFRCVVNSTNCLRHCDFNRVFVSKNFSRISFGKNWFQAEKHRHVTSFKWQNFGVSLEFDSKQCNRNTGWEKYFENCKIDVSERAKTPNDLIKLLAGQQWHGNFTMPSVVGVNVQDFDFIFEIARQWIQRIEWEMDGKSNWNGKKPRKLSEPSSSKKNENCFAPSWAQ